MGKYQQLKPYQSSSAKRKAFKAGLENAKKELAPFMTEKEINANLWWSSNGPFPLEGIVKRYMKDSALYNEDVNVYIRNLRFTAKEVNQDKWNPVGRANGWVKYKFNDPVKDGQQIDALAKRLWPKLSLLQVAELVFEEIARRVRNNSYTSAFLDTLFFFADVVAFKASCYEITTHKGLLNLAARFNHCAEKGSFKFLVDKFTETSAISTFAGTSRVAERRNTGFYFGSHSDAIDACMGALSEAVGKPMEVLINEFRKVTVYTSVDTVDEKDEKSKAKSKSKSTSTPVAASSKPKAASIVVTYNYVALGDEGKMWSKLLFLLVCQITNIRFYQGLAESIGCYINNYHPDESTPKSERKQYTKVELTQKELKAIAKIVHEANVKEVEMSYKEISEKLADHGFPGRVHWCLPYFMQTRYNTEITRLINGLKKKAERKEQQKEQETA